jgi:hypothetical protein
MEIKKLRLIAFGEVKQPDTFQVIIPECCQKNLDSCPHKVKRGLKVKRNMGL